MRFIGSITNSADAYRFGDYLTGSEIPNTIEQGSSGFSVWVHNDDQLDSAKLQLDQFNTNPADAKYREATKVARQREQVQDKKQQAMRKNFIDYRTRAASMHMQPAPLTIVLVVLCIAVAIFTKLGEEETALGDWLSFGRVNYAELQSAVQTRMPVVMRDWFSHRATAKRNPLLPVGSSDILHGQLWRLFTPMFIHFGVMHLVFNLMMLFQLGVVIEKLRGAGFMLVLVLVSAMIGNVAQFYWNGPFFGGMSGVIYALFGYLWIKSIVSPGTILMSKNTVTIMLAWLVMCMVGIIPNVANAAHVGGLLVGMIFAHAPHSWKKMRRMIT